MVTLHRLLHLLLGLIIFTMATRTSSCHRFIVRWYNRSTPIQHLYLLCAQPLRLPFPAVLQSSIRHLLQLIVPMVPTMTTARWIGPHRACQRTLLWDRRSHLARTSTSAKGQRRAQATPATRWDFSIRKQCRPFPVSCWKLFSIPISCFGIVCPRDTFQR